MSGFPFPSVVVASHGARQRLAQFVQEFGPARQLSIRKRQLADGDAFSTIAEENSRPPDGEREYFTVTQPAIRSCCRSRSLTAAAGHRSHAPARAAERSRRHGTIDASAGTGTGPPISRRWRAGARSVAYVHRPSATRPTRPARHHSQDVTHESLGSRRRGSSRQGSTLEASVLTGRIQRECGRTSTTTGPLTRSRARVTVNPNDH